MKWQFEERPKDRTYVQGVLPGGFAVNDMRVRGSLLALPDIYLEWRARSMADISRESLSLVRMVDPPLGACSCPRSRGRAPRCARSNGCGWCSQI